MKNKKLPCSACASYAAHELRVVVRAFSAKHRLATVKLFSEDFPPLLVVFERKHVFAIRYENFEIRHASYWKLRGIRVGEEKPRVEVMLCRKGGSIRGAECMLMVKFRNYRVGMGKKGFSMKVLL